MTNFRRPFKIIAALCAAAGMLSVPSIGWAQIFVTNYASGTIGEYNFDGSTVNASLISGLVNPVSLVVSGTTLFVGNQGPFNGFVNAGGTVGEYSTSGATINAAFITGLQDPFGLVVSGSNLFVSDVALNTIGEYNGLTGQAINASLISGLNEPLGLAVVGSKLYVASVNGGNGPEMIGEYSTSGAVINTGLVTGLAGPFGLAVSGPDLFVDNEGTESVGEYNAVTGQAVSSSLFTLPAGAASNNGLAALGSDLYLTQSNGTVGEYSTSGALVNVALISGLNAPVGIAIAPPISQAQVLWLQNNFTSAQLGDPTISSDLATPAGDGIPNFLKYAFNLNPFADGHAALPQPTVVNGNLVLTFTEVQSDVTYIVEASTDLVNWSTTGVVLQTNGNQVTANYPLPTSGSAFLHVVVSSTP